MHDRWADVALREVVEIKHGYAFAGKEFSTDPSYPTLVTPRNFRIGGGFQQAKIKTFGGTVPDGFVFEPGDLMVTMTDLSKTGDTLGYPAFVPRDRVYLHNQRIGKVVVRNPDLIDLRYLALVMQTTAYRAFVLGTATGSTVRHTSPNRILDFKTAFPPIDQQRRIAGVLGALDDLIDTNRQAASRLDALCHAVGQRFIHSLKDHPRVQLDELATICKGYSYKSAELVAGGAWLVNLKNVGRNGEFQPRGLKPLTGNYKPIHVIDNGDTCVAQTDLTQNREVIGRPIRVRRGSSVGDLVASLDLVVVRPHSDMTNEYVHAVLDSPAFRSHALGFCNGTTVVHMASAAVLSFEAPLPDREQLLEFSEPVRVLRDEADASLTEAERLEQTRDELLPLLLSGRVCVGEVAA